MGKQGKRLGGGRKDKYDELGAAYNILGGATVILCLLALYGWLSMDNPFGGGEIAQLSVDQSTALKGILYGGDPWVIMCDARPVDELFGNEGQ
jgi:hypothetical protein